MRKLIWIISIALCALPGVVSAQNVKEAEIAATLERLLYQNAPAPQLQERVFTKTEQLEAEELVRQIARQKQEKTGKRVKASDVVEALRADTFANFSEIMQKEYAFRKSGQSTLLLQEDMTEEQFEYYFKYVFNCLFDCMFENILWTEKHYFSDRNFENVFTYGLAQSYGEMFRQDFTMQTFNLYDNLKLIAKYPHLLAFLEE